MFRFWAKATPERANRNRGSTIVMIFYFSAVWNWGGSDVRKQGCVTVDVIERARVLDPEGR